MNFEPEKTFEENELYKEVSWTFAVIKSATKYESNLWLNKWFKFPDEVKEQQIIYVAMAQGRLICVKPIMPEDISKLFFKEKNKEYIRQMLESKFSIYGNDGMNEVPLVFEVIRMFDR